MFMVELIPNNNIIYLDVQESNNDKNNYLRNLESIWILIITIS